MTVRIRSTLAALSAAAVVITALVIARHGTAPVVARTAHPHPTATSARGGTAISAPPVAAPVDHLPWFGLRVITGAPSLHQVTPRHAPPAVNAVGGILIDADTSEILWDQNPHAALPPASTTKVVTALVALANFDPNQLITITPEALQESSDETLMGLVNGEKLTVQELITGALMVSGNDAATAVAADTVGMPNFVAAMNAQVSALGLHDSHFVTPVGLEDPGQRASAYDMAVLARTAVDHFPLFRSIVATPQTSLPATPTHHQFDLYNLNQLLHMYPGAAGIKPGWTGDAGYCLVGMAVRDGHRLISVLLNAPRVFGQSSQLLDWGFVEEGLPPLLPPPAAPAAPAAPARR